MKSLTRPALAVTGTLALSAALVLGGAGAAQAYPEMTADVDITVFINGGVNDPFGTEVANELTVLESFGPASLTPFDGGDGSAAAWSAALAGVELLVIPDPEVGNFYVAGGTPWVSEAAFQVIKSWIEAGNLVIANGNYYEVPGLPFTYGDFLTGLTGKAFSGATTEAVEVSGPFDLVATVPGAPDPLPLKNGTYSLPFGSWADDLQAITVPIYQSADTAWSPVLTVGVGQGAVVYVGYDWYLDANLTDEWAQVLALAVGGDLPFAPQPVYVPAAQLAATGSEIPVLPIAGGAGILLLAGAAALIMVRRRTA